MIISESYDVEVTPNFFSIAIVDIGDYLNKFKDACRIEYKKGKEIRIPIPLVQVYTVAEIKKILGDIKKEQYYITDEDDSQLFAMVNALQNMKAHYNDNHVPVITHMFGYNSDSYDTLMIAAFLMYVNNTDTTKKLIYKLYETSKKIIELQNDKNVFRNDYFINSLRKFKLPFKNIDVMKIFALNKVGKGKDSKGNDIYFGKGLKQVSINLQWYELLEHTLPPISEKDIKYYKKYDGLTFKEINKLVDDWDRYIIKEWIDDIMHYNLNDVFIVCEIIRLYIDEIRLRYNISKSYEVDVLSSSRSDIANKLFIKFYSDFSGLMPSQWRGKKTERRAMSFKKVIFPFIEFKTDTLKQLLNEMKSVTIYSVGKDAFQKEVKLGNLVYTIATGGLHSQDTPRELRSKLILKDDSNGSPSTGGLRSEAEQTTVWDTITDDSYIYVHWDIASFYPSIMDIYDIAPAHLNQRIFVKLIHWLKETRINAKHSEEEFIDGIPKDILAQVLKIVINSIYGKLGYEEGDICDRLAVLKVTINGQLMIMMLCESLELAGIEIISANTDGIVVKLYKKDKEVFERISTEWKQLTKLDADSEEYKCYINRDINNYLIEEINGKISYKGALNPFMYAVDLQKGYDMPIVAQAVVNYFLYNKPILETLYEANNILDFCKTQNIGKQFHTEYYPFGSLESIKIQRNIRFYVSNKGGSVFKVNNNTNSKNNLCAGFNVTILNTLDDKNIALRDINYSYYFSEALKIIDPIKLGISPNTKGNKNKRTKSGKSLIKLNSMQYNSLFDDNEKT